ncbi:MAG TPA: DEAD/DEAH box helicase family protein [Kaistia sp.]|jgi:hypothetical protein|nr:DEAD/DEAH box helicase family protein [Kaistia sp.]
MPHPPKVKSTADFRDRLAIARWMLDKFGAEDMAELTEPLRDETLEGLTDIGEHRYLGELLRRRGRLLKLPEELLRGYDHNIVALTERLNERRRIRRLPDIRWKHFQWLTLVFVEYWLDRYFTDAEALKTELNLWIADFNADVGRSNGVEPFAPLVPAERQLNKLAIWCATGAGKTLLMHANIRQYEHYLIRSGKPLPDHVVLLTPNEDLSTQHERELEQAGIRAELFSRDGMRLFRGSAVEIIDIHKLADKTGDKTVAVDEFEGRNLVLVDEGHRGLGRGEEGAWLRRREKLCENGFSFEYSATFKQAVAEHPSLSGQYARAILVNYSYRYFYGDGFGKDYSILNLDQKTEGNPEHLDRYLVGAMMVFHQQMELFDRNRAALRPWQIERPLWVFVGQTVTGGKAQQEEAADVENIVRFLARVATDPAGMVRRIGQLMDQGLVTARGRNLFDKRFNALMSMGLGAETIYRGVLSKVFNAPGAALDRPNPFRITYRRSDGELALSIGAERPFGVINVSNAKALFDKLKSLSDQGLVELTDLTITDGPSLFTGITTTDSPINLLIGSRKFTEGWSSWRVSTIGLMNLGKGEGTQVIQMFGRGVRLKGLNDSLKRSKQVKLLHKPPAPDHLQELETLNVFGIRASYMATFAQYLDEEDIRQDSDMVADKVEVEGVRPFPKGLKTIRVAKTIDGVGTDFGHAFRKLAPIPTLAPPGPGDDWLRKHPIVVNWYPRIEALQAAGIIGGDGEVEQEKAEFPAMAVPLLDLNGLWFELERYKAQRGWHNLNIPRDVVGQLLRTKDWYVLYAPRADLKLDSLDKLPRLRDLALALLRKYMEHFYLHRKDAFERPHLVLEEVTEADESIRDYRFRYPDGDEEAAYRIMELREFIQSGRLQTDESKPLQAVKVGAHLFQPLIHFKGKTIEVTPVALNKGEWQFVLDLKAYCEHERAWLAEREVYCLRNLAGGRGVTFFQEGNYQPDFIVWARRRDDVDGPQDILFVDPKGLGRIKPEDPKVQFHRTVKDRERDLNAPSIRLHAFLLAVPGTDVASLTRDWQMDKNAIEDLHVLFQDDGGPSYLDKMFRRAGLPA